MAKQLGTWQKVGRARRKNFRRATVKLASHSWRDSNRRRQTDADASIVQEDLLQFVHPHVCDGVLNEKDIQH